MDPDPWTWETADVQRFFRHDAIAWIADRPGAQLPPLGPFVQALGDFDVYGPSLLETLDVPMLRDQFGIRSVRHQNSVMYCIHKLRHRSKGYDSRLTTPRSPTPTAIPPAAAQPPANKRAATDAVSDEARSDRAEIEDEQHNRKRRRLDLTQLQPAPDASDVPRQTQSNIMSGYFPETSTTVDEIFYGATKLGHEIGPLPPRGHVLVDSSNPEKAEDNFQFAYEPASRGEAEFAFKRLLHFLSNAETVTLRRRGRDALAVLPYPKHLSTTAQSATVIQAQDNVESFVAVREQAALLHENLDYSGMTQEPPSEFGEHLLEQWKQKEDDYEVSVLSGSGAGDDEEGTTDSSDSDSQSEAEEGDEEAVAKTCIAEIIDEEIQACAARWKEKRLPVLEANSAWSVWKQMRQSRTLRDIKIESAQAKIARLSSRLEKQRESYLDGEWPSIEVLRRACLNLQPTIEDREMEKWNISVWQRRQAPAHTVKRGVASARSTAAATQTPSTRKRAPIFHVDVADRMSISPTPVMPAGVAESPRDARISEDGHEFHTPKDNTFPSPIVAEDDHVFIASDEMSVDDDDEPGQSEVATVPEQEAGADTDGSGVETLLNGVACPPLPAQPSPMETPNQGVGATQGLRNFEYRIPSTDVSDNDAELPPPSSFVPISAQRPSPRTPSKIHPLATSTQPIEISDSSDHTDSFEALAKPRKNKCKGLARTMAQHLLTGNPDEATAADVDSWDYSQLKQNQDRYRWLIKLLRDAGPDQRESLHNSLLGVSQSVRMDQLRAALRAQGGGDLDGNGLPPATSADMIFGARLAMAWYSFSSALNETDMALPWAQLSEESWQLTNFLNQLISILKRKGSKMFHDTDPREVIDISDDEPGMVRHTPSKKGRPKQRSQSAKLTRNAARARFDQYTQIVESHPRLNSSQELGAANGEEASRQSIAINPAKREEQDFIYIHRKIAHKMKAHQIDGVRFMWHEITASGEEGDPQGCLLAHTMGLGKTIQCIALLVAIVETSESRNPGVRRQLPATLRPKGMRGKRQLRVLILCPPALLQNWRREIEQWAPRNLWNIFVVEASSRIAMMEQLDSWYRVGGVLLIGYSIFRNFLARHSSSRKRDSPTEAENARFDRLEEVLLQSPEIVVADEAHNLKNTDSGISKQANRFATHTRIALTGTPMSNDVQEIYAIISWVAPGYLGEPGEFRERFAQPIERGQYFDSTRYEIRKSIVKLRVLHNEIEPKVNRADITALKGSLKPKIEFVLTVPLTKLQTALYERYVNALLGDGKNQKASQVMIFGWLGVLELLTNHPSAFQRKLLTKPAPKKNKRVNGGDMTPTEAPPLEQVIVEGEVEHAPGDEDVYALGFSEAEVNDILRGVEHDVRPHLSAKVSILLQILQLSKECGDQVLLFSHSIPTLDYLSELFNTRGIAYGRIDGRTQMSQRMQLIDDFSRSKFNVMLVSTRAGGTGLNMQGANRVIIFDFSFNPSWEQQAVGRAYRFGQTKPVYVYRFVAGGTFEANLYNTQLFKTGLSSRVVDKKNPRRNAKRNTRDYLYKPEPVHQEDLSQWIGKDPQVLDKLLRRHGTEEEGKIDTLVRAIQTLEVLQEEAQDEPLNEDERKQVDEEIEYGRILQRGRKRVTDGMNFTISHGATGDDARTAPSSSARFWAQDSPSQLSIRPYQSNTQRFRTVGSAESGDRQEPPPNMPHGLPAVFLNPSRASYMHSHPGPR